MSRVRLESRWIHAGGWRIHSRVCEAQARLPVVCVHGLGVSSRYLVPIAERLAPDFPVYVPDLPGFGLSSKPRRVLTLPELADALAAFIEAERLGRVALLGNSFGCQIIAELAVRRPKLVDRAVLQGPTIDPHARQAPWQLLRWMADALQEPISEKFVVLRDYLDCGMRRVLRTFEYALEDRIEDKLLKIEAPTLVVRGTRDPVVSQQWAEEAARRLSRGRLIHLVGAPHTANYSASLELARVVKPFLLEGCRRSQTAVMPPRISAEPQPAGSSARSSYAAGRAHAGAWKESE